MSVMATPTAQSVTSGKYRLGPLLGTGGMGTVYAAEHLVLGERVAVKFLRQELAATPAIVERFLREARSLFRIHAENVVRVLDVEAPTSGLPFLVMEYVEGESLETILQRRGRLTVEEAIEIGRQTCAGLGEAHRLGIVHRDVKPHNVMVTARADGSACVKVVDFGIAQIGVGDGPALATRLTVTEAVIGTPCYMSPEQLRSARDADPRSDVWSVGVLLFELLTGDRPWDPASPGDLVFRQYTEAVPLEAFGPNVPREIAEIVMRCLEIDPTARWQNAGELSEALERYARPTAARPLLAAPDSNAPAPPLPASSSDSGNGAPRPRADDANRALTFARQKVRTTHGGTAFERHELVRRGATPVAVRSSAPPPATPQVSVQSTTDQTLVAVVLGVGAIIAMLVLLLFIVARGPAQVPAPAAEDREPAANVQPSASADVRAPPRVAPAPTPSPALSATALPEPTTSPSAAEPKRAPAATAFPSPTNSPPLSSATSGASKSRPRPSKTSDPSSAPTPASTSIYTDKW